MQNSSYVLAVTIAK